MNKEIIETIKKVKSVDELKEVAIRNGYNLTDEEAKGYFDTYHNAGKITESDLNNISGGGCGDWCRGASRYSSESPHCLIVTIGNHCSKFQLEKGAIHIETCGNCEHSEAQGFILYCTVRKFDDDEINPPAKK